MQECMCLYVTDCARHERSAVWQFVLFALSVPAWVTVVSQKWVCYWQLSPSPWAGEAACCVGRGYTCSGPVRPRYRCTSHLRPVPSCRSASPPLGSGTEPAVTERKTHFLDQVKKLVLCLLLLIYIATKQTFQNAWGQTRHFILPACINSNLKSVAAL